MWTTAGTIEQLLSWTGLVLAVSFVAALTIAT